MRNSKPVLIEVGRLTVTVVIATISASASAGWTVRGILAENDKRISQVESNQKDFVAHITDAIDEIRKDVRELRNAELGGKSR